MERSVILSFGGNRLLLAGGLSGAVRVYCVGDDLAR